MARASGSFRTEVEVFGELADGTVVHRYTLANDQGMTVRVLTYGGILQSIEVPDRDGRPANVVLGFADLDTYVRDNTPYFGAVIGRYANRIGNGTFTLDGTVYRLPINNPPNSLHGGTHGFDKQVWRPTPDPSDGVGVRLTYESPDGEMGYPGTLTAEVDYSVNAGNELQIDYRATADAPTVVNLTNHSYFNLAGEAAGSITGHLLQLQADRYTPVDATQIPTGELARSSAPLRLPHAPRHRGAHRRRPRTAAVQSGLRPQLRARPPAQQLGAAAGGAGRRPRQRQDSRGVHPRARHPVLLRQPAGRDAGRLRRAGLSPPRRLRARNPALPGRAEPAAVPVDGAAASSGLPDHPPAIDSPSPTDARPM